MQGISVQRRGVSSPICSLQEAIRVGRTVSSPRVFAPHGTAFAQHEASGLIHEGLSHLCLQHVQDIVFLLPQGSSTGRGERLPPAIWKSSKVSWSRGAWMPSANLRMGDQTWLNRGTASGVLWSLPVRFLYPSGNATAQLLKRYRLSDGRPLRTDVCCSTSKLVQAGFPVSSSLRVPRPQPASV